MTASLRKNAAKEHEAFKNRYAKTRRPPPMPRWRFLFAAVPRSKLFLTHKPLHSLVDDVLGHNAGDKVPMEKVVMLLWAFRDDPSVVKFMAQFVSKVRMNLSARHGHFHSWEYLVSNRHWLVLKTLIHSMRVLDTCLMVSNFTCRSWHIWLFISK